MPKKVRKCRKKVKQQVGKGGNATPAINQANCWRNIIRNEPASQDESGRGRTKALKSQTTKPTFSALREGEFKMSLGYVSAVFTAIDGG